MYFSSIFLRSKILGMNACRRFGIFFADERLCIFQWKKLPEDEKTKEMMSRHGRKGCHDMNSQRHWLEQHTDESDWVEILNSNIIHEKAGMSNESLTSLFEALIVLTRLYRHNSGTCTAFLIYDERWLMLLTLPMQGLSIKAKAVGKRSSTLCFPASHSFWRGCFGKTI